MHLIDSPNTLGNDHTAEDDFANGLSAAGWRRLHAGPFMDHVGTFWAKKTPAGWRYGLHAQPRHLNPAGKVHGGVMQTLIDHALSVLAWQACDRKACITLQTDSQFLSAVDSGEFIEAHGIETHRTRGMIFMRGMLEVEGKPVLQAQGIFKIVATEKERIDGMS